MSLPNPAYIYPPETDPLSQNPLPMSFRYVPPVKIKRSSTHITDDGSVVQTSSRINSGGSEISFRSEGLTPAEFAILNAWYEYVGDLWFNGYWQDSYHIFFQTLNVSEINGCLFTVDGVLVVHCVLAFPVYDCHSCLAPIE